MRTTTVKELGSCFPIGMVDDKGGLQKAFEVRPIKAKVDRMLGLWKKTSEGRYNEPGQQMAALVAKFVSLVCSQAGSKAYPLTEKGNSSPEAEGDVFSWHFADVMYFYLWARIQALGEMLEVSLSCPACGTGFTADFDLTSIEVTVLENREEIEKWVELKKPFTLRDGATTCRAVKLTPIHWSTMVKPGALSGSMEELGIISMQEAIRAINKTDEPYLLTEAEIDELSKLDYARLNRAAGALMGGVDLRTVITCENEKCKHGIINPLDWSYDHFFGLSPRLEI